MGAVLLASDPFPKTTQIDWMFSRFLSQQEPVQFRSNCDKPKAFRGFRKFKVDCLEVWSPGGFEDMSPHKNFGYILGYNGWKFQGSQDLETGIITKEINVSDVLVYERSTKKPGCNRRIYAKFSWDPEDRSSQPGDKLYIADPYTLFCDDARLLI